MRTEHEVREEIIRLHKMPTKDENGLIVRMITMIAFEWVLGQNPVAPSERIMLTDGESAESRADQILEEGEQHG